MLPANAAGELQLGTKRPQMLSVTDSSSFYPISAPKHSWAGCSCTLQHPWHLTAATTALGGHPPRLLSVEVAALSHRSHLGHPARAEQGFSRLRSTKKQLPGLIPGAYFQTHCISQAFGHAARERARWPLGVTGTPGPSRWQRVCPSSATYPEVSRGVPPAKNHTILNPQILKEQSLHLPA